MAFLEMTVCGFESVQRIEELERNVGENLPGRVTIQLANCETDVLDGDPRLIGELESGGGTAMRLQQLCNRVPSGLSHGCFLAFRANPSSGTSAVNG
jgi:hypothetical protein